MKVLRSRRLAFSIHRSSTRFVSAFNGCLATPTSLNNRPVTTAGAAYHLRTTQNAQDRSQPGAKGQDRSVEVRDLPRNRERVIGIEPTTLCLASTRSSQLSYTRKSEEVLVAARLTGVNQRAAKVVRSTPMSMQCVHGRAARDRRACSATRAVMAANAALFADSRVI